MTLAVSSLDHNGTGGNSGSTVTTASVTPAASSLLMLWIAEARAGGITVTGISGFGTWAQVTSAIASASTAIELWTCQTGGSPGTGTVTITFSASGSASEGYDLWQVTGHNTATPLIASNTKTDIAPSGDNPTIAFGSAAGTGNLFAFGVCANSLVTQTPAADYAEQTDASYSGPSVSLETQLSAGYTDTSAGSVPSADAYCAAIGVEINSSVVSIPGVAAAVLVRAAGTNAYNTAVLGDAPVTYWPDTTGTDATGNGHTLTAYNSPGLTGPLPNGDDAYVFNGTTQYCQTPSVSDLSVLVPSAGGTGIGTYEAWIRPDVLTFPVEESDGYVHWAGKGTPGEYEWVHRMYGLDNTAGRENRISGYSFNLSGGQGDGAYWQTPGGETAGVWLYYVLVINYVNTSETWPDGYVTIYRDTVNTNIQTLAGITPGAGTAPLRIATRDFASYFEGAIGKYALYDYELTPAQVAAHYNAMLTGSAGPAGASGGGNVTGVAAHVTAAGGTGTPGSRSAAVWALFSWVPGMAVPGMAQPASDGTGTPPPPPSPSWQYIGPWPLSYLDYIDLVTSRTLSVTPGGQYAMRAVNSRAGLTIPPPDNRWQGDGDEDLFLFRPLELAEVPSYAVQLHAARAHNAARHARIARGGEDQCQLKFSAISPPRPSPPAALTRRPPGR